ncbi:hypothetical protein, conserved [Eimeria acervulina]|uniref:HIT-type domain-containing protein n=1 Tax=Eimeria acervulina TaxID=5801 RepID=U6GN98_EIMAC|nr:hypothetical protein, conserved [Eimeria acervulina]CDI80074.1 hypothetical protein, conserved [Eimeria acervulina]
MTLTSDLKVCQVCKDAQHKYVCPKCRLLYCSLLCYKQHNSECVAAFHEEEFAAAAAAATPTLHEQREFNKKLTRFYRQQQQQQQQDDEEEEQQQQQEAAEQQQAIEGLGFGSSEEEEAATDDEDSPQQQQQQQQQEHKQQHISKERLQQLQQLAAAGTLDLQHLTAKESAAFFAALKRGELAQYLQPWKPWWLSVELPSVETPAHICCRPTRPDPRLAMTLMQVVFAYAHYMRTFNGAFEEGEVEEAAGHFLAIARCGFRADASAVELCAHFEESKDPPPSSAIAAVDQVLEWAAQPSVGCAAAAVSSSFELHGCGIFGVIKAEFVLRKLGFLLSAVFFHWEEQQQQRQQLLKALQQRRGMLQQLQQIKKKREEAKAAARTLDACGSSTLAAAAQARRFCEPPVVVQSSSSTSSSSSSSSSSNVEESFKREAE